MHLNTIKNKWTVLTSPSWGTVANGFWIAASIGMQTGTGESLALEYINQQ
jgi:hypothetical protein